MKFSKYIVLLSLLLLFSACEDYFGEDANIDPDNPTVVTPNVILPQVQARLVYTYGGDFTRYVSINTQHVDGISRQFAVIGQYGIQRSDLDNAWSNIYSGTLNSNQQLLELSVDGGFNHYTGIALALETYAIMVSTDFWGDIPYTDAFKFAENGVYSPTYDTQEAIYTKLFANLEEARMLFGMDAGGNVPSTDDLLYGGDISKWIKFCNVLEARGQLHLSKIDEGAAYSKVVAALAKGGFESPNDNIGLKFGQAATENAPWYQYIDQRDDCETGVTYTNLLTDLNDPRIATYGQPQALPHPIFTKDQRVNLLSFTEQEFIRAEALLATDAAAAYNAYLAGINVSMAEALITDETLIEAYLAQTNVGVGADNLTLENIITQKYIALYTDPEVFSDWRRTGIPALVPITGTAIPRRLPYAQSEEFSNINTPSPSEVTIFSRVWWDR